MRAELPTAEADQPPLLSAALVAGVCLALGLGIARWTVGARPPSADGPEAIAEVAEESSEEPTTEEAPEEPSAEAPSEPIAEDPIAEAATAGAEPSVEPAIEPSVEPVVEPAIEPRVEAAIAPIATAPRGPVASALDRGRVAYLRCEGGQSGGACARDRALEDAIWNAIQTLPACAAVPPAPGQADLVVELSSDGREVRARDTFAADVVRLDGAAVVGCLSAAITADPVVAASTRRVVLSFRFALTPL